MDLHTLHSFLNSMLPSLAQWIHWLLNLNLLHGPPIPTRAISYIKWVWIMCISQSHLKFNISMPKASLFKNPSSSFMFTNSSNDKTHSSAAQDKRLGFTLDTLSPSLEPNSSPFWSPLCSLALVILHTDDSNHCHVVSLLNTCFTLTLHLIKILICSQ